MDEAFDSKAMLTPIEFARMREMTQVAAAESW